MKRVLVVLLLAFPGVAHADRVGHMAGLAEKHMGAPCLEMVRMALPWGHLGESALPGCRVAITNQPLSRKDTCLVAMHEAGHKAGLPHSGDPDSIMFPDPTTVNYPPCVRFDVLELRLDILRDDLHTARHVDRSPTRRLVRRIRRVKRLLGP